MDKKPVAYEATGFFIRKNMINNVNNAGLQNLF